MEEVKSDVDMIAESAGYLKDELQARQRVFNHYTDIHFAFRQLRIVAPSFRVYFMVAYTWVQWRKSVFALRLAKQHLDMANKALSKTIDARYDTSRD